jgi:glucokinase-like ROK family protein
MGIGMPGLLDVENGVVLFSPDFHWENVQLVVPIKTHFSMAIHMENSNRAQAMGEKWFGVGVNSDYFISVNIGHGIGSAIVEQGDFYRGSCGSSGELGHITVEKDGPQCDCGNYGCLEVLASGHAIAERAKLLTKQGNASMMLDMAGGAVDNIDAKIVFDASKAGDSLATDIVKDAIEYIGIGLANYINLLDPDMIILAGGVINAGDILIDGIKEVVKIRQMKFAGRKVKIKVAKLGADATAVGAASLILKSFIESGGNPELHQ